MFDAISYIRQLCKAQGIAVSKLERDLGFSNGYLSPGKVSRLPHDRAVKIAEYLGIDSEELLSGKQEKPAISEDDELNTYLDALKNREEMRILFSLTASATKEDVEKAVKIIEALFDK